MRISSPVSYGSGAYIAHKSLESGIDNYKVSSFSPYWEYFPPAISYFRDKSADLIHAPVNHAVFSRLPNKPLISTFHGFVFDKSIYKYSSISQKIHYSTDLKWLTKKALKESNIVTCVSNYLAMKVKDELGYSGDIRTIYNGVNINNFFPKKLLENKKIKVLFCGDPSKKKGVGFIPSILDLVDQDIELIYTSGLRSNRVLINHPRANCLGSVPHNEMPSLYNQADIFLFPSIREGFGLAIAEAMACGLPIITSNCSALPELVDNNKGGYLCEVGDVEAFSERVKRLAQSPQLRKEMGQYNRIKAENFFALDRMVSSYKALFEEALS